MRIPKIIHFIWAGGDNPMLANYINNVIGWKQANPTFEVCVWQDKRSASSKEALQNLTLDHQRLRDAGIIFRDIEEPQLRIKYGWLSFFCGRAELIPPVADEFVRYELDRLRPNYGASSDLLRYRILYELGGAYFDGDVLPGARSLAEDPLFNTNHARHLIACCTNENPHRLSIFTDSQGQAGAVNNDGLICTPRNPHMLEIYQMAKQNYTLRTAANEFSACMAAYNAPNRLLYHYDSFAFIEETTPMKTGPGCVRLLKMYYPQDPTITKMEGLARAAKKNGRNWIGLALNPALNLDQCLKAILSTVRFEAEKFYMFRLDDHISNLREIQDITATEALNYLHAIVNQVDVTNLSVQLTFQHAATVHYCREHQLLSKTFLFPGVEFCLKLMNTSQYYNYPISAITLEGKCDVINNFLEWESQSLQINKNKCALFAEEIAKLFQATSHFYNFIIDSFYHNEININEEYLQYLLENLNTIINFYKKNLFIIAEPTEQKIDEDESSTIRLIEMKLLEFAALESRFEAPNIQQDLQRAIAKKQVVKPDIEVKQDTDLTTNIFLSP